MSLMSAWATGGSQAGLRYGGTSEQHICHQLGQGLGIAHTSIPNPWEVEAGGSGDQGQPGPLTNKSQTRSFRY